MKILALEFSSPQRSVAVVTTSEGGVGQRPESKSEVLPPSVTKSETGEGLAERTRRSRDVTAGLPALSATSAVSVSEVVEAGRANTMKPLGMVEEALKQAGLEREQIECLAVGLGPGSYTGIRVAIALAQGWQLARGVKLIGVSSVEALAAEAGAGGIRGRVSVVVDAQRNEFYLATYEISAAARREIEPLKLAGLAEVEARAGAGGIVIGPEAGKWFGGARAVFPRAAAVARLAASRTNFTPGEKLEPIYLREAKFVKATILGAVRF